jgi:hypothetical protein
VPGLKGIGGSGTDGFGANGSSGYLIPISTDTANYALDVYVFATGASASPAPEVVGPEPTRSSSVILVETPVPGQTPAPTPTRAATATPRPAPIVTATPHATEAAIISSTAVARARLGTVEIRILGCANSIDTFDLADCAQAVGGFDVRLVSENGDILELADATVGGDGSVTWANVPLGTYLFQQPQLLPGTATYYIPDLPLAANGNGYVLTIDADQPVASFDIFNLPASAAAASVPGATSNPALLDSDADGIPDVDEAATYGTDPGNADSDFDGVTDGAELAAGTNPLVADSAAAADTDGDGLLDADEVALGTDPVIPDSDADGWLDGAEVSIGTDPLDGGSFPTG